MDGLPRKPPTAILWIVTIIYVAAFSLGAALGFMIGTCIPCEEVPGHGKKLFTTVLAGVSAATVALGLCKYMSDHHNRYKCMGIMPPIYVIMSLLWIINFGIYAVSFPKSDLDLMKRVIWLSSANFVLCIIITIVSFSDWRKYGKKKNKSSQDGGVYESEDANYDMGHMGGHHDGSYYP